MTTKTLSCITATLLLTTHTFADTTLEDITVISTNKVTTSIKDTTSNITVITQEDILEHGYQTVAQAINTVAGISVAHSGGLGQQTSFFVRGADSGKVLVLLDGMRLNDPSSTNGTALLDSLTTNNIAQIEIIKGGAGSIWGSNASTGVINIITKQAQMGVHGSIGLSYGSYATKGTDLSLAYKDEKLSAQVLASYLDTDSFSALAPRDAEKDGYNNKNINLKLGYVFNSNNTLQLSYNNIKTKTQYDDSFSPALANDDYSHATSNQKNIALNYLYTKDNYSATFQASKGDYDRDYYTTSIFGDGHNVYKAILKEYAFINAYDYSVGKIILGFEYKDIDGFQQFNTFASSQSDYTNTAIYLSNIYHINEKTLLETNLRYDKYSEFDNKTTYKLGIKHRHDFVEGFETSANYYTSYDAPSAYQLANPVPGQLLKPSYVRGYDISIGYKDLLRVTYFDNKVTDSLDYIGFFPNAGYANIDGTSKFSGLEVESQYNFPALNLIFSANYTHLYKFKKEDGSNLPRRAKDTLNASLTYYTDHGIHFGVDTQYIGDREEFGNSTGNYTVWNLNFSTKIMDNIQLSINAKNIFDKEYQSVFGYATEGRSAYAKVSYSF
jgi:vitamin B12 transporter